MKDFEMKRLSWIIQANSQWNSKHPYKRNAEDLAWREEDAAMRLTMEAETGGTWPHVKGCWKPGETAGGKGQILSCSLRREG